MARRPIQFPLAALVWLVFASAVLFSAIRNANSAALGRTGQAVAAFFLNVLKPFGVGGGRSGDLALVLAILPFVVGPVAILYLLRPKSGRRRSAVPAAPAEPAAPLRERLRQFIANVSYIEPLPEPGNSPAVLPDSLEGKPARTADDLSGALDRIRDAAASRPSAAAKSLSTK